MQDHTKFLFQGCFSQKGQILIRVYFENLWSHLCITLVFEWPPPSPKTPNQWRGKNIIFCLLLLPLNVSLCQSPQTHKPDLYFSGAQSLWASSTYCKSFLRFCFCDFDACNFQWSKYWIRWPCCYGSGTQTSPNSRCEGLKNTNQLGVQKSNFMI